MSNFVFNKEKHEYLLDGKPLTGVTSVLQVIAKPALIQWSANETVKYLKEKVGTIEDHGPSLWTKSLLVEDWYKLLEEARKAHLKKKKDAGTKGTDTHGEIEIIIKGAIKNFAGYIQGYAEIEDNEQIKKFCNWATENKVRFLSCEEQVYSEKYWLAGTYDFIAEIDGKKFVGDVKTSNAIYGREYFAQCAAYRLMLEEMGQNGFTGSVVVRLGKDGSSEVMFSEDYQEDKKLFLACLDVYRSMGTFGIEEVKQ